ncbi:MAG TPA: DUF3108 domain-containing protein [Paucimonas sp.]|nr:DUF3108 domain-containing protein [Paucimonas sp.]
MTIRKLLLFRFVAALLLPAAAVSLAATAADGHAAFKYKVNLPPSAELGYAVTAKQSGFPLDGKARVTWQTADGKFMLDTEMRAALFGKILDARTEGEIDDFGLAPAVFTEKRLRKEAVTASFNREAKTIVFNQSNASYPIKGGEQDRNSATWQLIAIARAAPAKFKPGSEWPLFVVGARDAEAWAFKVLKHEKIRTPLGELDTVHVLKTTPSGSHNQQVDIWLAPALEWYPARIRYTEPDGDFIEQTLTTVAKKTPG